MTTSEPHSHPLIERIQGEFREMPGLKLTPVQAQRLFGLSDPECESLLRWLAASRFLVRTRDGAYMRATARL
jgi:hypothetical protein